MFCFDIPSLYYYINLRLLITWCLFSGDIYLSLGISLSSPIFSSSFVTVSGLLYSKIFETFVILTRLLLPIKSPVASAVFWTALFEAVFNASIADCLAGSRSS